MDGNPTWLTPGLDWTFDDKRSKVIEMHLRPARYSATYPPRIFFDQAKLDCSEWPDQDHATG